MAPGESGGCDVQRLNAEPVAREEQGLFGRVPDGELTNHPSFDAFPAWSPDGTRIAFESRIGPEEIFVVKADGPGAIQQLTTNRVNDIEPAWTWR